MDTVLQWKQEPESPLNEAYLDSEDTFYQVIDDVKFETDLEACESKAEVASHILENLENLMDLDDLIKDEPFPFNEKILPMLEEVDAPRAVPVPLVPRHYVKADFHLPHQQKQSTQSLLQEFDAVYEGIEYATPVVALTPPQSPPTELTVLEPLLKNVYTERNQQNLAFPDVEQELAMVDELVRRRAEDMQWHSDSSSSASSASSPGRITDFSSDGDPEWVPEPIENYTTSIKLTKKRSKPYSDDKKSRKKEQNKNAATRYRMKKKAEVEEILSEEKVLLDHNTELGSKITDLEREIKYLKGLMRDLFKAKGLIQ